MDKNELKTIKQRVKQFEQYCSDNDAQNTTLENISRRGATINLNHSSKKNIMNFRNIISRISRTIKSYKPEMLSVLTFIVHRLQNGNLANTICVFILLFCSFCMLFYSVTNVTEWVKYRHELQIAYDNISKDTLYVRARQFDNLGNKNGQWMWHDSHDGRGQSLIWNRDKYNSILKVEKMPVLYC